MTRLDKCHDRDRQYVQDHWGFTARPGLLIQNNTIQISEPRHWGVPVRLPETMAG